MSSRADPAQDTVVTNDFTLSRSLKANLGDGDNFLSIKGLNDNISGGESTFISGGLKVSTGSGADKIEIGQESSVIILGQVSLFTGNESSGGDTVMIDNSQFYSSVLLDLGAGNDVVLFDTVDNLNTSATFHAELTVLGRSGDDVIAFGQSGSARFGDLTLPPTLNGGGGTDQLLLIHLYVAGIAVDTIGKLGQDPLKFEGVVF